MPLRTSATENLSNHEMKGAATRSAPVPYKCIVDARSSSSSERRWNGRRRWLFGRRRWLAVADKFPGLPMKLFYRSWPFSDVMPRAKPAPVTTRAQINSIKITRHWRRFPRRAARISLCIQRLLVAADMAQLLVRRQYASLANEQTLFTSEIKSTTYSTYTNKTLIRVIFLFGKVTDGYVLCWLIFTARCTLVQSAVLRSHVVCLSVRLSVCLWRWWIVIT